MIRIWLHRIGCIGIGISLALSASAAVGPGPQIYVFPFQPVYKGVSNEVVNQTSELLKNEIKQSSEVRLLKGPIFIPETVTTAAKPLSDKELTVAGKLFAEGKASYEQLAFDKAVKSFQGAQDRYEKSLALLTDFAPVVENLLMLSVCHYRMDQEDEGAKMLVKVIRLNPNLVLDPEKYPPMFRNTAEAIRKKLLLKTRGELEVVATEEGADVFFNGQKVGATPILLKDLVPGEHFVRVERAGLQTWAEKVTVVSTQRVKVLAALGGAKKSSGPLGLIADALRANQLNPAALKTAQAEAKKMGADYMVLGGVSKVSGEYRVGAFLFKADGGELCPLPEVRLDPDMLGASVEVYNLASNLYKRVEGCPDPVKDQVTTVVSTVETRTEMATVSLAPAVVPQQSAPVEAEKVEPVAPEPIQPVVATTVAPTPAVPVTPTPSPARTPATPRAPAQPGQPAKTPAAQRLPAEPPQVATTSEGLVTTGGSALGGAVVVEQVMVPRIPTAEEYRPIDEQVDRSPRWYESWWFWTAAGLVVAGAGGGIMYATGVFDGGTGGASVTVHWPTP